MSAWGQRNQSVRSGSRACGIRLGPLDDSLGSIRLCGSLLAEASARGVEGGPVRLTCIRRCGHRRASVLEDTGPVEANGTRETTHRPGRVLRPRARSRVGVSIGSRYQLIERPISSISKCSAAVSTRPPRPLSGKRA